MVLYFRNPNNGKVQIKKVKNFMDDIANDCKEIIIDYDKMIKEFPDYTEFKAEEIVRTDNGPISSDATEKFYILTCSSKFPITKVLNKFDNTNYRY